MPFLVGVSRLRWRRIWALARLSFKEAVRRKVPYVFASLGGLVLYGQMFGDTKPESQLQTYVQIVYPAITVLLLLAFGWLAAFSIPTDIRQQSDGQPRGQHRLLEEQPDQQAAQQSGPLPDKGTPGILLAPGFWLLTPFT